MSKITQVIHYTAESQNEGGVTMGAVRTGRGRERNGSEVDSTELATIWIWVGNRGVRVKDDTEFVN